VSKKDFNQAAVEFIRSSAENAIKKNGVFSVALSGGTTPLGVYKLLAEEPFNRLFPWYATHIFWGDERCVPYTDERSNYKSAYENLISKINIPTENIHKIPFITNPEKAAAEYEKELKLFFKIKNNSLPEFDLILLGMGNDGHTASLFPNSKSLKENKKWVIETDIPEMEPQVKRITFTLPVINNAREVLFLISGKEKQKIVDEIIKGDAEAQKTYPAAMVKPKGKLTWMMCEE
jgi:6-phosphogluconolactonase